MSDNRFLIGRMAAQVNEWQTRDDRRSVFLNCYMLMTSNMMTAIEQGRFEDPEWVGRLLHLFADYYFGALDGYGRPDGLPPAVWAQAFNASVRRESDVLQDLLLGVNAHINYDLVLTLVDMLDPEWNTLSAVQRDARYRDHCLVNCIIAETIDLVQDTVLELHAPRLDLIDRLFGRVDEWMISQLITRWRERVWHDALAMLAAVDDAERAHLQTQLEHDALKRGRLLLLLPDFS